MQSERSLWWDGMFVLPEDTEGFRVQTRHRMADAAKAANWDLVLELIEKHPEFVNSVRPHGNCHCSPLHQAAYAGAPVDVVRRLIELGASRTLRNAVNERAVDIAVREGKVSLIEILEPKLKVDTAEDVLAGMQVQFHALIKSRVGDLVSRGMVRLPILECLTEFDKGTRAWFPVRGMMGGFAYRFDAEEEPVESLDVSSWSRMDPYSLQDHRVYRDRFVLIK